MNVSHPAILSDWKKVGEIHMEFHTIGDRVIDAVKEKNSSQAHNYYLSAEKLSNEIFSYLDKIVAEVDNQTTKGVNIFRNLN